MAKAKAKGQERVQNVSIVDLLLFDHQYLKECVEVLTGDRVDRRSRLAVGRGFLDALQKHSQAERKAVYGPLEANEELHFTILEAEIEHGIVDQKVRALKSRLAHQRTLSDETASELKVLAELVRNHLREEESEFLPKLREAVEDALLEEIGGEFMAQRRITPQDLGRHPRLDAELLHWKASVKKDSNQFVRKMDKYVENIRH